MDEDHEAPTKVVVPSKNTIPDPVVSELLIQPGPPPEMGTVTGRASSPFTLIDLTLDDNTDDEGNPSPVLVATTPRKNGSLVKFGKFANSLRPRGEGATPADDHNDEGCSPKVVTPQSRRGTKNKKSSCSSDSDPENDDCSLFPSSSDDDSDNNSLFTSSPDNDDDDNENDDEPYQHIGPEAEDDYSDDNMDLFASSDDEADESQGQIISPFEMHEGRADEDDDESRFSEEEGEWMMFVPRQRPPRRPVAKKKLKKEKTDTLVTDYKAPPEERKVPEFYYFAHVWGMQMRKVTLTLGEGPPPPVLSKGKYHILVSDLVTRKGKGFHEDKMGSKYYKSHYLKLSDSGVRRNIESALLSIGDFESLTYEHGPHKTLSRLKLLVSPSCRPPDGAKLFCFHELPPNKFDVIEDDGHLGCGFIHPAYLVQLLGNSQPAQRVFAIQVRIIGPSSVGIAKGMLFVKEDIAEDKIQLPTSMIKVNKSRTEPLHTHVVLNIRQCFPSSNQECMGRLFDNFKDDPTLNMIKALKPPSPDVQRVILCKGVNEQILQQYLENLRMSSVAEAKTAIKHGNFVGVTDPTGHIPFGHVFLTGMGERAPHEVFLTRYPCTEGKDGIVAKVATWRDMPGEAFQFLDGLDFGAVVFSLGVDPLPPTINDGDLDGDLYACIWDPILLASMTTNPIDECLGEVLSDGIVGMELKLGNDDAEVIQKLSINLYRVAFGAQKNKYREMTREEILEGRDYILAVVGHRACQRSRGKKTKSVVEFKLTWSSSNESTWWSTEDVREKYATPPDELRKYLLDNCLLKNGILPTKFVKWVNENIEQESLQEVVKHKTKRDGSIDVLCRYSDGSEDWIPMAEARADCKRFLGAYAKTKKLFDKPGWEGVSSFWVEEVCDLMCKEVRSHEISNLVPNLNRQWRRAFDALGANHNDTIIWGRAYKASLEIEKHDGFIKLPLHLYRMLPKDLQKFVEEIV